MATQLASRPLEPFGVEVDCDLRVPLNADQVEELRALYHTHKLLVFNGQSLTPEQQGAVMAHLGPVVTERDAAIISNDPKRDGALGNRELAFHVDMIFCEEPFGALSLHALDVENGKTSTLYQNNIMAYDRLPQTTKDRIASLKARAVWPNKSDGRSTFVEGVPYFDHPIANRHPRTGEATLFVSAMHTCDVLDMPKDEGEALLDELIAEASRPGNVHEHFWHVGDLVIWDNMSCSHARGALSDVPRTLQRVSTGKGMAQVGDKYGEFLSYHFRAQA